MISFSRTFAFVLEAILATFSSVVGQDTPLSSKELHARAERVRPQLEKALKRFEARTFSPEKGAEIPYRFFGPENREEGIEDGN